MSLLVGTADGVYLAEGVPFEDAERVLDAGKAPRMTAFDGLDGVYAATMDGLYRSTDGGRSWEDLAVPTERVWEVRAAGDRLLAGTQPAHLYASTDEGASWTELPTLRNQPTLGLWRDAYGPDEHLRAIAAHPETPERLFAGVEAGGLYRSEDGGESWGRCAVTDGSVPGQDDIHHVVPLSPESYVVACGRLSIHDRNHAAAVGGLYRTDDAGTTWTRLDADLVPSYFKTVLVHAGTLYACASTSVPPEWPTIGADATTYVSEDDGETWEALDYPGGPREIVLAWAADGERVYGGSAAGERGRVVYRDGQGPWETAGFVPEYVHSVHPV